MKEIAKLLENNKTWAANVERSIPGFFHKLETQHKPKFPWIGCSDSRVPADQLIGVKCWAKSGAPEHLQPSHQHRYKPDVRPPVRH